MMKGNGGESAGRALVSIITPVYNSEKFLRATISAVRSQSYQVWEHILVDDCSSDRSAEIVRELATKDRRIKLIENERNGGPGASRNRGIEHASGKFIAFCDSDDYWHPQKLEWQIKYMEENDLFFSYGAYQRVTEDGEHLDVFEPDDTLTYWNLLRTNQVGCLTAVYDAKALGKMYMDLLRKRQDYGLWLNILKSGKVERAHKVPAPEPLAYYRVRQNSVSSNKLDLVRYNWALLRKHQELDLLSSLYFLTWQVYHSISK